MIDPLFTIGIPGAPCASCGRPAKALLLYTDHRIVDHGQYGCYLPEPGADEPHAPVYEHWRVARRRAA